MEQSHIIYSRIDSSFINTGTCRQSGRWPIYRGGRLESTKFYAHLVQFAIRTINKSLWI